MNKLRTRKFMPISISLHRGWTFGYHKMCLRASSILKN